jgi:ariadne-1
VFFDHGLEGVLKRAGITADSISSQTEEEIDEDEEFECPLCYDDFKIKDTSRLACSHRFCNGCWRNHIEVKIKEGQRNMKCMFFKCNEVIDENVVLKVLMDQHLKKRFEKSLVESFIEDNNKIKWCTSTPSCGNW